MDCGKFIRIRILITVHRNANELSQGRAGRRVQGSGTATTPTTKATAEPTKQQ